MKGSYGAGEENFHRINLLRESTEAEVRYKRQKTKESKVRVKEAKLRMLLLKQQLKDMKIAIPELSESNSDSEINPNLLLKILHSNVTIVICI